MQTQSLSGSYKFEEFASGEGLPLPIIFKAAFGGGGRGMRRTAKVRLLFGVRGCARFRKDEGWCAGLRPGIHVAAHLKKLAASSVRRHAGMLSLQRS